MRTATIVAVYVSLGVILTLLGIMIAHWRRFRAETDRYRAWQSVFGQRGAKVALVIGFVALATLVGALLAFQAQPVSGSLTLPIQPQHGSGRSRRRSWCLPTW